MIISSTNLVPLTYFFKIKKLVGVSTTDKQTNIYLSIYDVYIQISPALRRVTSNQDKMDDG